MQRLWQTRSAIVCSLSLTIMSCQHAQSAKDASGLSVETEKNKPEADDKVQMELWSPARRKANASFYYLAGEYEAMSRNGSKARKLYENAYNLDPNPFLAVKLIETKAGEDIEEAVKLANKMVLLYPEYAALQLLYGRLLTATGNLDKAEEHLLAAVKVDKELLEGYVYLVHLYQAQQKYKQSIAMALQLVRVNPSFAEGWAQLSRLYLLNKQAKLALEPARRAYDLANMDPEKVQLYALVLDLNGEKAKAAQYYDAIVKLDPTNDDLITRMVSLYKAIGTLDEAITRLIETEKVAAREVPGIRLQMVFIYWEQQEFLKASELLDALTRSFPQSERLLYMAGLGQERTQQATRAVETYVSFDPSSEYYASARYRAIDILRRQDKFDEALKIAEETIASQIDRAADFYTLAAQILAAQKKFGDAITLLDSGFEKYPDRFDLLFLKAVNQERNKQFERCIDTLKALLAQDPEHAAAHNYLGYLYAERKEHLDEAEAHIKKALEIKPDDGYYLDSLGWVHYQQGEYQKALDVLLKANQLIANEAVVLEHIADTYVALGQRAKAREFYEKAMQTKMEDQDKQRIAEKYAKIKADP